MNTTLLLVGFLACVASAVIVHEALTNLLSEIEGVSIHPPAALFMNERLGEVFVRGTPRQCEAVKHLLRKLKGRPREVTSSKKIERSYAEYV